MSPNIMSPDLDKTFAALSDPTRRAILARLASGEATVNELAEPFERIGLSFIATFGSSVSIG
jgi:DNA-binding transcriptional ArsR family regulator